MDLAGIFRSSQSVSQQPTINGNELLYRIAVSVSTATDIVARLAKVKNLPKAFIDVSSGYYVDLPPDGTSDGVRRRAGRATAPLQGTDRRERS